MSVAVAPPPPAAAPFAAEKAKDSVSTTTTTTVESVQDPPQINSINDLILHKAATAPDAPLIAYPDSANGLENWIEFTASQLDLYADEVAKELSSVYGLKPKQAESSTSEVVALLGPSNLDYAVSILALTRMGFAVFFLSTRLATEAYVALLEKTNCTRIITTPDFAKTVEAIRSFVVVGGSGGGTSSSEFKSPPPPTTPPPLKDLETFPLIPRSTYTRTPITTTTTTTTTLPQRRFIRETRLLDESSCVCFIIHSSGSTGLPKPIFQTHRAGLGNYAVGSGLKTFAPLPLFHNSGLATLFRGIVAGVRIALFNASMAMTNANLVRCLSVVNPQCFQCVPYTLKILSETQAGIEALKNCEIVIFGGSPCPDELGDLLVSKGVFLVAHYGQTEMGQLMMSTRSDRKDTTWNYLRPLPDVEPYLKFAPVEDGDGDGTFESVCLPGLKTKVISNAEDGSYHTRDCFTPHPTRKGLWKYVGRLDDRLTLVNGEKVLPLPMEGRIRQSELVAECLVFGAGRAFPGLLVVPSAEYARGMTKEEILDRLEPVIREANENAEKFAQISREMIEVLEVGADYPKTDKGTMIRAAAYKRFAERIDGVYARFENADGDGRDKLRLELGGLKEYLRELLVGRMGVEGLVSDDSDFFSAGIDSLQAIMARGHIMRQLDLAGNKLVHNVVYENPSIEQLARHIDSVIRGTGEGEKSETDLMKELVDKYGVFRPFEGGKVIPDGDVVLLTGATGSLGAHILSQLLPLPHIRKVYCLVRSHDSLGAMSRVLTALHSRGLVTFDLLSDSSFRKIVALPSDMGRADLGLSRADLLDLQSSLTAVIHSAWAVNFNVTVKSLEAQHIRGVRNLLDLCLSVPFAKPASFSFISSISAAAATPSPATVAETYVADPAHAQAMGYARSKWVSEHIVRKAVEQTGMAARVLRSGQIVGDAKQGRWNPTEAIPLQIRSALTLGALPALDETPSWLPVDVCAQAVIELSGTDQPFVAKLEGRGNHDDDDDDDDDDKGVVYHVQNPRQFRWTEELLPALKAAGLEFEVVNQREWVKRLREGDQDPVTNPTVKLLDFFAGKYDNDKPGRKGLGFATAETEKRSKAIAAHFDVLAEGTIAKCVDRWREVW